jgi:hypothetical protein
MSIFKNIFGMWKEHGQTRSNKPRFILLNFKETKLQTA